MSFMTSYSELFLNITDTISLLAILEEDVCHREQIVRQDHLCYSPVLSADIISVSGRFGLDFQATLDINVMKTSCTSVQPKRRCKIA